MQEKKRKKKKKKKNMDSAVVAQLKQQTPRILQQLDWEVATAKIVRRRMEKELSLKEKTLDASEYKALISQMIDDNRAQNENEKAKPTPKLGTTKDKIAVNDDQDDFKAPPPSNAKLRKHDKPESKEEDEFAEPDDIDGDDSTSKKRSKKENTDDFKDQINTKRPKKGSNSEANTSPKQVSSSTKSEDEISKLKNFISKCGIRKIWSKELQNLSEKQQVQKLKKILEDAGVEGRPTFAKCADAKKKLERKKELEGLDTTLIVDSTSRSTRRSAAAATQKMRLQQPHDNNSESEDENESKTKREAKSSSSESDDGDSEEQATTTKSRKKPESPESDETESKPKRQRLSKRTANSDDSD